MIILYIIVAIAVGYALGYLLQRGSRQAAETKAEMLAARLDEAKADAERQMNQVKNDCQARLFQAESKYKEQLGQLNEAHERRMQQQLELLKEQLANLSVKSLKERAAELSALNTEQLSRILNPLNERIAQMKEAVEKSNIQQTETSARLGTAIKHTVEQAEKLGKATDNLVSALSHDNKYQGNFGEMHLRQMLENMGFERGKQFEEQVTLRDENGEAILNDATGNRMQPDVILHFPDRRDIIIDAKTSMNAFFRYSDKSLSDSDRHEALKDHIAALRTQVKSLSQKGYWRQYVQKGIKLDFVVMYVPSEAAFNLAASEDINLWNDAFNVGVFITGPQNLYALLRLLEVSWKQVAQVENQQNIINCANDIVKRVQLFYERFLNADAAIKKTQKCFDELKTTLAPSGPSIITSANKLLSYGAHEDTSRRRALPKEGTNQ
ncbi:MAG: DNA recombination protein RmuC [Prevotella sp.]|nr:DNA recombination protein RmuC [Prevotella sp.]